MIKKIQSKTLNLFKEVVDILDENEIMYYIIGGTLLGAVRHKGFIPWDDDIDILIPRNDYNKLIELSKKNKFSKNLEFNFFETSKKHNNLFGKVCDVNTTLVEGEGANKRVGGVNIDIFPLDNSHLNKQNTLKLFKKVTNKKRMIGIFTSTYSPNLIKKVLKLFIKPILKIFSTREKLYSSLIYLIDIENNKLKSKCSYKINYFGAWGNKEIWDNKWFEEVIYLNFEGLKLKAPKHYHKILTHTYGDYMKMPRKEKQVSHHNFTYINLNKPYKQYIKEEALKI